MQRTTRSNRAAPERGSSGSPGDRTASERLWERLKGAGGDAAPCFTRASVRQQPYTAVYNPLPFPEALFRGPDFSEDAYENEEILLARNWFVWTWAEFNRKVLDNLHWWSIQSRERADIRVLLGKGTPRRLTTHATNALYRQLVADRAVRLILDVRRRHRGPFYLITFIDERWNTLDRQATMDFAAIKRLIHHVWKEQDLQAFGACELQAITNHPGRGRGRIISGHSHAIVWSDKRVRPKKLEKDLAGRLTGTLNAAGVVVTEVSDTEADLAFLVYYLLKGPCVGKYVQRGAGGVRTLQPTVSGLRDDQCARMAEIISQVTLRNVLFGRGEGDAFWREALKVPAAKRATFSHPGTLWKTARKRSGKDTTRNRSGEEIRYAPAVVLT